MDANDRLELDEPRPAPVSRAWRIGFVGVLIVFVALIGLQRFAQQGARREVLSRAGGAWNGFVRCMLGAPLDSGERSSQRLRRIWIATRRSDRPGGANDRSGAWPRRCTGAADRALAAMQRIEVGVRDVRRLREALEAALGELRQGEIPDRVEMLFSVGRASGLPDVPDVPDAPSVAAPTPARIRHDASLPLIASAALREVSTDPSPGSTLRWLFSNDTARTLCESRDAAAVDDDAVVHCRVLQFRAVRSGRVSLLGAAPGAPSVVRWSPPDESQAGMFAATNDARLSSVAYDGFVHADRTVSLLHWADAPPNLRAEWVRIPYGQASPALPPTVPIRTARDYGEIAGPEFVGDQIAWIERGADELSHLFVRDVPDGRPVQSPGLAPVARAQAVAPVARASAVAPVARSSGASPVSAINAANAAAATDLGAVPTAELRGLLSCRSRDLLALAFRGAGDAAASAVFLRVGGSWRTPARAFVPRGATLACDGDRAVLIAVRADGACITGGRSVDVEQVLCDARECSPPERTTLRLGLRCEPRETSDPAVGLVGAQRVILWSHADGTLRMRAAPFGELGTTDDIVLLDDANHGGITIDRVWMFSRGDAGAALLRGANGYYALSVDATGRSRAIGNR